MAVNQSTLSSTGSEGTISGTGKKYVSAQTWEAEQQDLHQAPDTSILQCYRGTTVEGENWRAGGIYRSFVQIKDWVTSPTSTVTIQGAPGNQHNGVPDAGFLFENNTATGYCVQVDQNDVIVQDFQAYKIAASGSLGGGVELAGNCTNVLVQRMILHCSDLGGLAASVKSGTTLTGTVFRNCLIYRSSGNGTFRNFASEGLTLENCTADGAGANTLLSGNASNLVNCVSMNSGGNTCFNQFNSLTNCASEDGSGNITGVSRTPGVDFVNITADWNVQTGSTKLDGTGSDLSGQFRDDITATPDIRPAGAGWEIGAYEIAGAGPTPAVLSNPTVVEAETSALIGCTTDTAGGTLYWYVSESATAPSAADLKAGTGAVSSGSFTPTLGANTVNATGLTASTNYWHYWIQDTT